MKGFFKKFEDTMAAITFAEAGEHEAALELLQEAENMLLRVKKNYQKFITPARSST